MRPALLRGLVIGALSLALTLATAGLARADVGTQIIRKCEFGTGALTGYTQAEYNQALSDLNGSAAQYSPCAQAIREAQQAALRTGLTPRSGVVATGAGIAAGGGGGGTTGGTGGGLSTGYKPINEAQAAELAATGVEGNRAVQIAADRSVRPDTSVGSSVNSLPTPLIVLLAALAAGGLAGLATYTIRRVRAHRAT